DYHRLDTAVARREGVRRTRNQALARERCASEFANSAGYTPVMAAGGLGSRDHDTRGRFLTEDVPGRSIEALDVLLKGGGEINATDGRGQTPLHGAAFWGWTPVVQFLADHGANLEAKDSQGKTPL